MTNTQDKAIKLIVGLGNPGASYAYTRHNVGAWFIERLAKTHNQNLVPAKKFFGHTTCITVNQQKVHLLFPTTFMNCSGQSVVAMANFYRIPPEAILVVHDELDFPAGAVRLKQGGGHGGHNGLKDIISKLGNNKNFTRLRIGIGHPGNSYDVTHYVLHSPSRTDKLQIHFAIEESIRLLQDIVQGNWNKAVQQLHTFKA